MRDHTAANFADCAILQADAWTENDIAFEANLAQIWGAELPKNVGDLTQGKLGRVLRIAPRRLWLLGDAPAAMPPMPSDVGMITSLSDGRVAFHLDGPDARRILAEFIAIDWDHASTQAGRAVQSAIHRIPVCIIRLAEDSFEVITPRSFARSIAELFA